MPLPVAAIIGAAAIGAGGNIMGGWLSGKKQRDYQQRMIANQIAWEREAAQSQIQWRVADAKKAGIHPLYALGQPSMGSSVYAGGAPGGGLGQGISEAGQNISNAIARMQSSQERKEEDLRLRLLEKSVDKEDAIASYYRSEAMKNLQAGQAGIGLGIQGEDVFSGRRTSEYWDTPLLREFGQVPNVPGVGVIDLQAPVVKSHKRGEPGIEAGTHPFSREFTLPNGMPITMPTSDEGPMETLEAMNMFDFFGMLMQNQYLYGGNWLREFLGWWYAGRPGWKGSKYGRQSEKPDVERR